MKDKEANALGLVGHVEEVLDPWAVKGRWVATTKPSRYYIWSFRHRQWWRPDEAGYTTRLDEAGAYDAPTAGRILLQGLPGQKVGVDTVIAANRLANLRPDEVEAELEALKRIRAYPLTVST